ncbi:hypothetical protein JIN84_05025 [Luteolibacter yonseiensis]|uniref:Uncharacterized protein n=1 Tax=Luteolibacter yonseiensis TaxID=1144680 RepID=A0A934R297_9BACT|nr:hypothetical protein [Luteolibacter yonseiensis]MBK1814966.1 hypothetical protein [Luteolibacter yonseiensis]
MKSSPYYPPRAGTLSRLLTLADRLVARVRMSQLMRRTPYRFVAFPSAVSWLLLPGLMWRGEPEQAKLGNRIMFAWAACVVVHIVSLNGAFADWAAILASMLHGISAAAVLAVLNPQWQGFTRMWKTSVYATLLVLVLYTIGLRGVAPVVAQRMVLDGETIMTRRAWAGSGPWVRGEWVVYRLPNRLLNIDRILAGPEDIIRFHKDSFEVDGKFFPRVSPHMPVEGEIHMDKNTYFIWPTAATFVHAGDRLPQLMLGVADIDAPDIVGRPYQHWFWKSTTLEALKPIHPSKP